jgi:hypothetical protein
MNIFYYNAKIEIQDPNVQIIYHELENYYFMILHIC